jgi:DNA-binding CsgD family transcriptional regulator/PAS domain-containing protein
MTRGNLPDLVAHAYEAACDFNGLTEWVGEVAAYFGNVEAALIIWPTKTPDELMILARGKLPESLQEEFKQRDIPGGLFAAISELPEGDTFLLSDAFHPTHPPPDEESPPTALRALIGTVIVDDVHRCCLTLFRDADRNEFSQLESDTLAMLMGYFRRAIVFNKRFIDIFNQHKTASAILDSAPRGIVTVGQNGQVTYSNAEAQRIFSQADGVSLNNNKINFRDEKLREKYAYFIEIAGQETETPGKPERMSAVIKRPSTDTPYQLMAYTLPVDRRKALLSEDEAHAVLIIQDATKNLQLRADLLQTFYNLSMAEANLAVTLYKGNTLPEAADKLHVSINTARSQLRGIFKKVGVNSQAMLLQALASGAKDVTRNTYKSSIN